jgi:PAS domain S-box-containing protein
LNASDVPPDSAGFSKSSPEQTLRDKATDRLPNLGDLELSTLPPEEIRRRLHELSVHQIELEIQNEHLRQIQVELDTARARYFDLYDLAPLGYLTFGEDGLIREANLTAATLLDVTRAELLNKPISKWILNEDLEIYYLHSKRLLESGIPQAFELRMVKKDKTIFWARLNATTSHNSVDASTFLLVLSDITEHKQAAEALRQSENRFKKLFRRHSAVMLVIDAETGCIMDANEAAVQFYGWSFEELRQMRIQEINTLPPAVVKAEMLKVSSVKKARFEFRHRRANGSIRDVEVYSDKIGNAGKQFLFSIIHDITERKQAEEALREDDRYLRTILQTTVDGFWVVDVEGKITEVNEAYCRMSGYTREELLKLYIFAIDAVEEPAMILARIQRIITNEFEIFETHHRRKDGRVFPVEISVTCMKTKNTDFGKFVCFCRDITERKQIEKALLENKLDFARAQEVGSIGSWRLDVQRNVLTWSDENHRIFGIPAGTPLSYETFLASIHPDDRSYVDTQWKAGLDGAPYDIEHRIVVEGQIKWVREKAYLEFDKDGMLIGGFGITQDITERKQAEKTLQQQQEEMQIILDSSPIMIFYKDCENRFIHVNKTLAEVTGLPKEAMEGKTVFEIYPNQAKNYWEDDREVIASGKPKNGIVEPIDAATGLRWVQTDKVPYKNKDGRIIGIIGFSIDITERKQAEEQLHAINSELERRVEKRTRELQEAQIQYLHAEKLAAIGKLSASIAHEFNNPMQGIMSILKGLKKRAILEEEDRDLLDAAICESDRMKNLIRSLQDFNRPSSGKKMALDVHNSIDSLLLFQKSDFKNKRISVVLNYAERLPEILAIPDQIKQVFLNLLTNAADACQLPGGVITISTWQEGERVAVAIMDTGIGVKPEQMDLLFQPFYSTKPEVKGTGLGLSVCHGIVKNHQGKICVESRPGEGTTFTVLLPIKASPCVC